MKKCSCLAKMVSVMVLGSIVCTGHCVSAAQQTNEDTAEVSVVSVTEEQTPAITVTVEQPAGNFLRRGQETVIQYDKLYNAYIDSAAKARNAIIEYGVRQRALYDNPPVKEIELQMEQDYGILAVNLGEMDVETAQEIEQAFAYMYDAYPILQNTLTNLTLANFSNMDGNNLAVTDTREFMVNEIFGRCPFVVKHEISLNASKFLNREKLEANYHEQIDTGHWTEGTNTTSVIVHELGHLLMDVLIWKNVGLYDDVDHAAYYITEDNLNAYGDYITDNLSANQTLTKEVVENAYELWKTAYGNDGSQEEFRSSISQYASGIQTDGGISYSETIAEAIADIYLHGEDAVDASKAIENTLRELFL